MENQVVLITHENSSPVIKCFEGLPQNIRSMTLVCEPDGESIDITGIESLETARIIIIEDNYLQNLWRYKGAIRTFKEKAPEAVVIFITKDAEKLMSADLDSFKNALEYQGRVIFEQVPNRFSFAWFIRKNGDESYLDDLKEMMDALLS